MQITKRLWRWILVLALVAVFVPTLALAQGPPGNGPDSAMRPANGWVEIQPGVMHWYKVKYNAPKDGNTDGMAPMTLRVYTEPRESVQVTMRNANQAHIWQTTGKDEYFGACTCGKIRECHDGKVVNGNKHNACTEKYKDAGYGDWSTKMSSTMEFYIVVKSKAAVPANYRLEVTGDGFSFNESLPMPAVAGS